MAYLVNHTPAASTKQKSFNGLRRTKDGMLYLTSVNPNKGNETIEVSKFYEDGKSDFVGRDQQDYVDERLEMYDFGNEVLTFYLQRHKDHNQSYLLMLMLIHEHVAQCLKNFCYKLNAQCYSFISLLIWKAIFSTSANGSKPGFGDIIWLITPDLSNTSLF